MPYCGDGGLTVVWCLLGDEWSDEDLQWWCASFTSWWGEGEGGSSPATSPSWATVWDCFHFPLVAPADPLRLTLPDNSFDSCLAHTSNVVQASLVVPLLKNLCLRWSQTAAARSWVGLYHGSHARDASQGSRTFSSQDRHSSVVVFGGGSWTRLR